MFRVTGYYDGIPYEIEIGRDVPQPSQVYVAADGSSNVLGLLSARRGQHWDATPTGPYGELDLHDPASILGALMGWTTVRTVSGDVPDIQGWHPVVQPGTVY